MIIFSSVIFFIVVAWYSVLIFRNETTLKKIFLPAMAVKTLAGFGLGLVYVFHYKVGDTLLFFNDATALSEFGSRNAGEYLYFLFTSSFPKELSVNLIFMGDQRSLLMVKLVSLFYFVSFGNYWVITFYLTLISFLGAWFLVRQIHSIFPEVTGSAITTFLFFPSIVFWTSGVIKETFAMASLYFICGVFIRIWSKKNISIVTWLTLIPAIYLLWSLKYYFAGIFLAVVISLLICHFINSRLQNTMKGFRGHLAWLLIFSLLIVGVSFLHPNFNAHRLLNVMVQNYEVFHQVSRPEAVMEFDHLQPTLWSVLMNIPQALFAGLFRPLFFDATNPLSILLSLENVVLLILAAIALRYSSKIFSSNVSSLLVAIIVYVILLTIFITLSTPNFGTLARYRVGYLPFFVFLITLSPPVATRLQYLFMKFAKARLKGKREGITRT